MKIVMFGQIDEAHIKALIGTDHVILTSDHTSDAKTVEFAAKHKVKCVAARAEWHNLTHETSQEGTRIGFNSNKPETYNVNGGRTRDANLVEQADAAIIGEDISEFRTTLVHASELPFRTLAAPKITPEAAEAELRKLFPV